MEFPMVEKIIYKWGPLSLHSTTVKGHIVHVGIQNQQVFVWAEQELDKNVRYLERQIRLCPTGEKYTGDYHGTVVTAAGLVWHVIEEEELQ
jgi:hypothetical protein